MIRNGSVSQLSQLFSAQDSVHGFITWFQNDILSSPSIIDIIISSNVPHYRSLFLKSDTGGLVHHYFTRRLKLMETILFPRIWLHYFALGNKSGGFCEAVNCKRSEQEGKFLFAYLMAPF